MSLDCSSFTVVIVNVGYTVVLFGGRASNGSLLATASLAVGKCYKPVAVAVAASPPELFTAVGRRVEVEPQLVVAARSDVRTQLAQIYTIDDRQVSLKIALF